MSFVDSSQCCRVLLLVYGVTNTRISQEDVVSEFFAADGIDEWTEVKLYHYEDEDVWEARYDGHSPTGETPLEALEALTVEMRHAER